LTRRIRRRFVHGSLPVVVLGGAACLVGFIQISFDPGSPAFHWPASAQPVPFVVQEDGSADVGDRSDDAAVRLGFAAWEDLASSTIAFAEDEAADASRTDYDAADVHLVMFDEDGSTGLFAPGSGVIALTPLLAQTADGTILDADIVFNGELPFATDGDPDAFDVQSVATHEVGHFIGLDHSGGPQATMFSTILAGSVNARSLCRDDDAAAATVYPAVTRGRISGTVAHQGGPGVRFGQVVAVDAATGEYAGGGLTFSGGFDLEGLPAGDYDLYIEPLDGPLHPADTIALSGQSADAFSTTWFPGNPVTAPAGGSASATWTVAADDALDVDDSEGLELEPGQTASVELFGRNVNDVVSARVPGPGVSVTGVDPIAGGVRLEVTADPGAALGVRILEVTDSSGRIATLTAGVEVHAPPPTVTGVSLTTLEATGGQNLTVDGAGFTDGSVVVIGGELCPTTSFFSDARLDCVTPASPGTVDPVDVVVIRPDGREGRLAGAVAWEPAPVPQSVDPQLGPTAGGTTHTVHGSGFATGAVVRFDGQDAQVLSVTGDAIEVVIPPGDAGAVDVEVEVQGEVGVLTSGFSYVDGDAPVVETISPVTGPPSGGTLVTLTGSDLPADAEVTFGGVDATQVTVTGGSQLTCLAPAHPAGAVEVRVRDPDTGLVGIAPELYSYAASVALPPPSSSDDGCALGPAGARPAGGAWGLLALAGALVALRRRRSRR